VNPYLEQIRTCILSELGDQNVSIALFGSRARGDAWRGSDVDIAVIAHGRWDERRMVLLREKLEELNVPYKVDVVDFSVVSKEFRQLAFQSLIWWKQIAEKL
jgi:hypothetical protein